MSGITDIRYLTRRHPIYKPSVNLVNFNIKVNYKNILKRCIVILLCSLLTGRTFLAYTRLGPRTGLI